jgi:hypothetical protein
MRKIVLAVIAAFALVFAGIALAAAPQGKLTGGADVATGVGISRIDISGQITDGETVYVARNNDKSGDCNDDAGSVNVRYGPGDGAIYPILCAHYTGNQDISVDYFDPVVDAYVVFRIRDRGQPGSKDIFEYQTTSTASNAKNRVNLGTKGSGNQATPLIRGAVSDGNYSVTAAQ